jgi:SET domain-containing protein
MYKLLSEALERLYEDSNYEYGKSDIHGTGVFASKEFNSDDTIDKATDLYKDGIGEITPMGSKLNHSWDPNCILARVVTPRGIYHNLIAYKAIALGDELTVDYSKYTEFKNPGADWK